MPSSYCVLRRGRTGPRPEMPITADSGPFFAELPCKPISNHSTSTLVHCSDPSPEPCVQHVTRGYHVARSSPPHALKACASTHYCAYNPHLEPLAPHLNTAQSIKQKLQLLYIQRDDPSVSPPSPHSSPPHQTATTTRPSAS